MPHTARARSALLVRGPGSQRLQLRQLLSPLVKQHVKKRIRPACSLITTPLLTELVKLTLSTSSVTNTNTIAAVSQAVGPNYLVWYGILCALTASVGTWVVHLTSYLWHNLFEGYVVQERSTQQKEENLMHGVDVTHSRFFDQPKVQEAVAFAAAAHKGQQRKTKEPYVTHCIETACIVEEVLDLAEDSEYNSRAEAAIIAAVLHDVLDDTPVKADQIQEQFGSEVGSMVGKVSQLSSMNQLLRRRRRQLSGHSRGIGLGKEEEEQLRTFIVNMVSEPLVLVIKLADRLHNMRTVFALKKDKQKAVATETLQVWCSLAERLGMMVVKAELEDLCFAVLHPHEYTALRNELNAMWGLQQITDLVPAQAETLLSQAAASARTAAGIAASSQIPQPRLPTPSPVPRPSILNASGQQVGSQGTEPSHDSRQQSMQSVQNTVGDLYASSERGMVRTAGHARINRRQQKALRSGLLRLSPPEGQRQHGSATAVLEPPNTVPTSPSSPTLSASSTQSQSHDSKSQSTRTLDTQVPASPQQLSDAHASLSESFANADSRSASRKPRGSSHTSSSQTGAAPNSPDLEDVTRSGVLDPHSGKDSAVAAARRAEPGRLGTLDQCTQRIIRGRTPRRALAAEMAAKAERQKSGIEAGPSGRVTPDFSFLSSDQQRVRQLVRTVHPFHAMGFKNHRAVPVGAAPGLKVLEGCARVLLQTIMLEGYASDLEVRVEGRLKSIYSIYKKMIRKKIPVRQVYDARALRIIVDDEGASRTGDAWAAAYRIQPAVHRLWRKVGGEYDDYIVNPKQSGYQSLHTAVKGPGGVPMEVQIRTAHMHEVAEYGDAAHWAYKENTPKLQAVSDSIQEKQPVVCHRDGNMRNGVVYSVLKDGLQFLAVVSTSNAVPGTHAASHGTLDYFRQLYQYAHDRQWFQPGHGDLYACLELYSKCQDGRFRREDHTGYKLPIFCTPLEAWQGQGKGEPGEHKDGDASQQESTSASQQQTGSLGAHQQTERSQNQKDLNHKTLRLRGILEWRNEVTSSYDSTSSDEVMVLIWPAGHFKRLPRGTTASQVVRDQGWIHRSGDESSRMVNVNNRLVPENTELQDGDFVVQSRELLSI